jgi:hypothetical protein
MGTFVSGITKGIQAVADDIAGMVTDTGKTIAQLTAMNQQFTAPALRKFLALDGGTSTDVPTALQSSLKTVLAASNQLFTACYPGDVPAGSDKGIIYGYRTGGDVQTVVNQIKVNFGIWQIPVDDATVNSMAKIIQTDVDALMGGPGSSHGKHNVAPTQYLEWTVAYGTFIISDDNTGIIYAYTAAFISGGF